MRARVKQPEPRLQLAGSEPAPSRARPEKILVSPDEAAELLSIGRTYLYELIHAGEIKSVQVGRLRRVPVAALHEYVEKLEARGHQNGRPTGRDVH